MKAVADGGGLAANHANWVENFTFTRLGPVPDDEKESVDVRSTASAADFRDTLGHGSFGDHYQAPEELMARAFSAAVGAMVETLSEL